MSWNHCYEFLRTIQLTQLKSDENSSSQTGQTIKSNKLVKNRFELPQLVVQYVVSVLQSTKTHHHLYPHTYSATSAYTIEPRMEHL